jgi:hypothetical protein
MGRDDDGPEMGKAFIHMKYWPSTEVAKNFLAYITADSDDSKCPQADIWFGDGRNDYYACRINLMPEPERIAEYRDQLQAKWRARKVKSNVISGNGGPVPGFYIDSASGDMSEQTMVNGIESTFDTKGCVLAIDVIQSHDATKAKIFVHMKYWPTTKSAVDFKDGIMSPHNTLNRIYLNDGSHVECRLNVLCEPARISSLRKKRAKRGKSKKSVVTDPYIVYGDAPITPCVLTTPPAPIQRQNTLFGAPMKMNHCGNAESAIIVTPTKLFTMDESDDDIGSETFEGDVGGLCNVRETSQRAGISNMPAWMTEGKLVD